MPTRSRRPRGRIRRLVLVSLASALCLLGITYGTWALAPAHRTALDDVASPGDFATLESIDADASEYPTFDRLVYRYSVIPGGAYTPGELRHAIQADPVVAAHYNALDQSKLQVRTVAHDQYAYVSYRKGDAVFWTKNKVLLRQGETIITDGTKLIRAKCGNCISLAPQLPAGSDEPDVVEFDRLADPVEETQPAHPEVALVPRSMPAAAGAPVTAAALAPAGAPAVAGAPAALAPTDPMAFGQIAGGSSAPLAAGRRGTDGFPTPPGLLSPPVGNTPPPGGNPPPLVPFDDVPPSFSPPDGPPPGGPTGQGDPVPVPEAGTLLLVAAGAAALMRRRRSR